MAKTHPGATLTPHFRDFLPPWLRRQPWYRAADRPDPRPVGFFRFEDPAGRVGVETHLLTDGAVVYQVPLTYRDAPLPGAADGALVATAEHSVLGTRWIYDGAADPVWAAELVRLVATGGVSEPSGKGGVAPAGAHGHPVAGCDPRTAAMTIVLERMPGPVHGPGAPAGVPDVLGTVTGWWHPDGPDAPAATGLLAVLRRAEPGAPPVVSRP